MLGCTSSVLQLEVPVTYRSLFAQGHPDRLFFESILTQCLQHNVTLSILTGAASDDGNATQNAQQQRLQHYRQAQQDPVISALLDTFDANILAREVSAHDTWLAALTPAAPAINDPLAENLLSEPTQSANDQPAS